MGASALNITLAMVAAAACLRAAYFMNGSTPLSIKAAFTIVFVALLGYALGDGLGQWKTYLDTLLFGGLSALFLADVRRPAAWVIWAQRSAWVAMGATVVGILFVA